MKYLALFVDVPEKNTRTCTDEPTKLTQPTESGEKNTRTRTELLTKPTQPAPPAPKAGFESVGEILLRTFCARDLYDPAQAIASANTDETLTAAQRRSLLDYAAQAITKGVVTSNDD